MSNIKHNLSKRPLYPIWSAMIARCYNQKDKDYQSYGGRGISVNQEWRSTPKDFIIWATACGWKKGLYLDRADNNKGYCPENCRFVTPGLSSNNTGLLQKSNTSGYRGVSSDGKKYQVFISINSHHVNLGSFTCPLQAALAYDDMAVFLDDGRPINFWRDGP